MIIATFHEFYLRLLPIFKFATLSILITDKRKGECSKVFIEINDHLLTTVIC